MDDKEKVLAFIDGVVDCIKENEKSTEIWNDILILVREYAKDYTTMMDEDEAIEFARENMERDINEGYL